MLEIQYLKTFISKCFEEYIQYQKQIIKNLIKQHSCYGYKNPYNNICIRVGSNE